MQLNAGFNKPAKQKPAVLHLRIFHHPQSSILNEVKELVVQRMRTLVTQKQKIQIKTINFVLNQQLTQQSFKFRLGIRQLHTTTHKVYSLNYRHNFKQIL